MVIGDWLEVSLLDGNAGTYEVSVHALSVNSSYQDRSVTLNFKTLADEVTRATITITQTSANIIVITRDNTEIGTDNNSIGYAN